MLNYGVDVIVTMASSLVLACIQRVTIQRVRLQTCLSSCSLAFALQELPLQTWLMAAAFLHDERLDNRDHFPQATLVFQTTSSWSYVCQLVAGLLR